MTDTLSRSAVRSRLLRAVVLAVLAALVVSLGAALARPAGTFRSDAAVGGPSLWSRLVAASHDLGPSERRHISVAVNLRGAASPVRLLQWAARHGLRLQWRHGDRWAVLVGAPASFDRAFRVSIHDFRTRSGGRFYGTAQHVSVPAAVRGEVRSLGRLGNTPRMRATSLVPPGGLTPAGGLRAYDATPLAKAGYDGTGETVVFFEWAPPDQANLDAFTQKAGLPPIAVERVGAFTADVQAAAGETELDLEVTHALAPQAKLVIIDANPPSGPAEIAQLFSQVDSAYPGAVWSFSIDWACDKLVTWPDLQVIDQALATAEQHGTSAFAASGDTDGLECKFFNRDSFSTPPVAADVGVLAVSSVPSMTSMGGTALSVTSTGDWLSESVWSDPTLSNGTGGGASSVIPRPDFQSGVGQGLPEEVSPYRLTPDLSADADGRTGFFTVIDGGEGQGGGTSQAAPILAGLTAVMNQYLKQNGGHAVGAMNPILYQLGTGHPRFPPFHDVTFGGNAVWYAAPGYDLASGWGTPDTWNLARDILELQKANR